MLPGDERVCSLGVVLAIDEADYKVVFSTQVLTLR